MIIKEGKKKTDDTGIYLQLDEELVEEVIGKEEKETEDTQIVGINEERKTEDEEKMAHDTSIQPTNEGEAGGKNIAEVGGEEEKGATRKTRMGKNRIGADDGCK